MYNKLRQSIIDLNFRYAMNKYKKKNIQNKRRKKPKHSKQLKGTGTEGNIITYLCIHNILLLLGQQVVMFMGILNIIGITNIKQTKKYGS